jgi:hypothetical protein
MPTVVGSVLPGLTSSGINGTSAVIRDNGVVSDPTWSLTIEENFVDAFSYTDFRSLRVQFSGIPPGVTLLTDGGAPPRLVENNVNVAEGFFDFGLVNSSRNSDWIGFESGSESGGVFSPTARSTVVVSGTLSVDSSAVFPLPTGQIRARVTLAHDEDNCPCEGLATFETELLPPGGVVVAEIVPAVPTVSVLVSADASEEGEIPGFFAVSRIGDTTEPLFVEYFIGGTATSGTDYAAIPRSVEIPAGEDFVFVRVDPVDDGIADPGETVVLTLAPNAFYLIGTAPAAMLIEDSEPRPVVTLSAIDTEAREGPPANTGQWTFERTGDTGSPLAVGYTIGGTATNGSDYATLSGSVTIPAGAASVTLTLTPIADGLDEGDETVILTLASLASYTVGDPASGTVVIQDPAPIDLDLSGNAAGSGTASIALTLTVDSPPAADLTGRMRFQFVPDPLVAGGRDGDEFIWFEPGGMTETTFRIPAGATTAADPASIRVGTVAGTLTVFAETLAGEVLDQHQIIVGATAPQIDSVLIERSGSLFTVYVVGFSTALEVTSATFTFNGPNVQPLPPVNVTIPFRNWFDNPASEEFGSMFMYTQPVTVTSGDANNVTSVTVTLRNTRGDSNSRTGTVN